MTQNDSKNEQTKAQNIYRNMYQDSAHRNFSTARHLLTLWKGSCFKLIWHNFAAYIFMYALISIVYRNLLQGAYKETFELFCVYCERFSGKIPITFLTGFYVSQVVNRWWDQFMTLPWPDRLALKLVNFCPGTDDFHKNLRRTVMRYVNLSTVLVYRLVSQRVMDRFPDYDSLIKAKLMLPSEVSRLKKADKRTPHETTWTPILWAMKLLTLARMEKKVTIEAPIFANLQSSFDGLEQANRKILNYGWVNFPLAYVQVATVSVYLYFVASLFGRQYLRPEMNQGLNLDIFPLAKFISYSNKEPFNNHTPDIYIPFFTLAEFFCYMGWIKVAEDILNPFGDDDEDFQINYLIDRNLQVSYLIVDEADQEMEIVSDPFLDAGIDIPKELPYVTPHNRPKSLMQRWRSMSSVPTVTADNASEITRNTAKSISTVRRLNKSVKKLRRSKINYSHIESSINVPSTNESGDKIYSESLPAMQTNESKPSLKNLDTIDSVPASPEEPSATLGSASAAISNV